MAKTTLHIGLDDTDSVHGMCTTFLAYKLVGMLERDGAEFVDFPRLVRFNPNIPWKTRGNGAVSVSIRTGSPSRVKKRARDMVARYSDTKHGANPGLVFHSGAIPYQMSEFAESALWRLVRRSDAKRFAVRHNLDHTYHGNGQGLVGAIGAIGYRFTDSTLELLGYRKRQNFGRPRTIHADSVRSMQDRTFPDTFNSFDTKKGRVMIAPHGPDPVFYGIRGENVPSLVMASRMVKSDEQLDGYMIFKSNQGTGDHLQNYLNPAGLEPYMSGRIKGTVHDAPKVGRGGHAFFSMVSASCKVWCAIYRPTGMAQTAAALIKGDRILVGGGVRKATPSKPRILNLEFFKVMHLAPDTIQSNPSCKRCQKNMKSKGRGQGFECILCGSKSMAKVESDRPRKLSKRLYLPQASAHRHLARPAQRAGAKNSAKFGGRWFSVCGV